MHEKYCKAIFGILTNIWRRRDVAVAQVIPAAGHIESLKGGHALLSDVIFHETAPLLVTAHPGIETVVSSASSILTCAFVILTYAQQLPIIVGV